MISELISATEQEAVMEIGITNSLSEDWWVVLEPWTGQYYLSRGWSLGILVSGDLSVPLEVEVTEDQIVVHAPDDKGALLRIFRDGLEIERSESGPPA